MAKVGRPRTPTNKKILQGTFRKDLANLKEPTPLERIPDPPADMDEDERQQWSEYATQLFKMGVLTEADGAALEALARYTVVWRRFFNSTKAAPVAVSDKGNGYIAPEFNVASMAFKEMLRLLAAFGLTPADRSRVVANKGGGGSKLDEIKRTLAGKTK